MHIIVYMWKSRNYRIFSLNDFGNTKRAREQRWSLSEFLFSLGDPGAVIGGVTWCTTMCFQPTDGNRHTFRWIITAIFSEQMVSSSAVSKRSPYLFLVFIISLEYWNLELLVCHSSVKRNAPQSTCGSGQSVGLCLWTCFVFRMKDMVRVCLSFDTRNHSLLLSPPIPDY